MLSGSLKNYSDRTLYVFATTDEMSQRRITAARTTIGEDGRFKLELPKSDVTVRYFLAIGNAEGIFYAEPGINYVLTYFPSASEGTFQRFDRTEVVLQFAHLREDDCNKLIPEFNRDLYAFLDEHFYDFAVEKYRGSEAYRMTTTVQKGNDMAPVKTENKEKIQPDSMKFVNWVDGFRQSMIEKYEQGFKNVYFNTHFRYTMAELEMMSGVPARTLYEEYLMSQPVQWKHPSYMKFFNGYYEHCLENRKPETQQEILRTVNSKGDPGQLYETLKRDSLFLSEPVGQLAIIRGLRDLVGNTQYSRTGILLALERMQTMPCCNLYSDISKNAVYMLKRGKSGEPAGDFSLFTQNLDLWKFSEEQKGYTYFFFYADWSAGSRKEMQMMQKLYEKYKNDVTFIAVSMDDHLDQMKTFMQGNRTLQFDFLFAGNNPELKEILQIKSIPHALMVTPDGHIMYDYTRKPSEGIQMELDKIVGLLHPKSGEKTWQGK